MFSTLVRRKLWLRKLRDLARDTKFINVKVGFGPEHVFLQPQS